jgi:peroxiredoxin
VSEVAPPVAGAPAPPLELPTIDGDIVRLTDLRGHAVLVSFLRHAG